MGQDIASKVGGRDGTKVSIAEPRRKAIVLIVAILHVARALWQFDIELDPEDGESLNARRGKAGKVQVELDSNEMNLLATICIGSIHNRQEDSRVICISGVVHLCTGVAVERQDSEVGKVAPVATKVAILIAQDDVNDGA